MILAGHGRVEAAKLLGIATVPCVRIVTMTAAQKRAYVLADNKLALNAGWDEEMLAHRAAGAACGRARLRYRRHRLLDRRDRQPDRGLEPRKRPAIPKTIGCRICRKTAASRAVATSGSSARTG